MVTTREKPVVIITKNKIKKSKHTGTKNIKDTIQQDNVKGTMDLRITTE